MRRRGRLQPLKPGAGPAAALAEVRKTIAYADKDRAFGEDIARSLALLRSQRVVRSVEHELGALH